MRSSFIVHRNRTAPGHFLWLGAVFEPRVAYIRSRVGFNLLARGPSWGAPLPSMGKGWRPRGDGQARRPRGADAAASRETIQLLGDPDLSAAAPPPAPAAAVPALAQLVPMASAPAAPLEDWQEMQSDGFIKCRACSKYADVMHCATESHVTKLASWRTRREGYAAPRLLYLAYVPCDKNDTSNLALKCLLCNKWVTDETAHSDDAAASILHKKRMRIYGPGDSWYNEYVTHVRARWHPVDAPERVTPEGVPSGSRDAWERLIPEGVPSGRPTREEPLSDNCNQPASAAATQAQGARPCHSPARAGASSPAPSGDTPASSGSRNIRDLASGRAGGTTSRTNKMDSPTHDAPERMTPEGVPLGSRDGAVGREAQGRAKRGRDEPRRDTRPGKLCAGGSKAS